MKKIDFLKKYKNEFFKENSEKYRGEIPWYLMNSKNDKVIYISSSNRNMENYFYTLDEIKDKEKKVYLLENSFQNPEEMTAINIELIDILEKEKKFVLFLNLQIALKVFFEKVNNLKLEKNKSYEIIKILGFLVENNYQSVYMVEKKGEYSKRGDILDIFPPNLENPVRIEFFDDEIDGIRFFDVDSQKSIEKVNDVNIYGNVLYGDNFELLDFLDEFKKNKYRIIMENDELLDYKLEEYILLERSKEDVFRKRYDNLKEKSFKITTKNFTEEQLETFKNKDKLFKLSDKFDINIFTTNQQRKKEYQSKKMKVYDEDLGEGFLLNKTLVLTDRELEGYIQDKRSSKRKAIKYKKMDQILIGDYVIHSQYGVGIYKGIENINDKDYLKINYADEDLLYIPIEKLNNLEKYISYGEEPKLFRLGTRGFKRRKQKLTEEIEIFAKELIEIQARRESRKGFIYERDTVWQEEFEEEFPFEETEDQKKAIREIKEDMESPRVMDRIVCGDVGYGKTEVAMRAAFKAMENGKQVAIIAPTTVLADQHYERFKQRFDKYPFRIETLSRLTEKYTKQTLQDLKLGKIDMVIGTHRILSKDVEFDKLGLFVIDEEQKFGVKAKEEIKKKKGNIDLLTLTATPIPRTLNLALLGIRDISLIETPPSNRVPIKTEILEDRENIKDAILKELSRDGQVFYIYNKVTLMKNKIEELKKELPDFIKIDNVHGKLNPKEIKDKIRRFERGDFDILVASTIIENGMDISNANTIIIEDFDKLGLSQIYQLRGRVGRSDRQGYCYLLKGLSTTKKGKKKTESITQVEGTNFGGFQLSLEDLKIRGAGEILGEKQHGTIETFGYSLYIKMLNEEIKKQKGQKEQKVENVEIILKHNGSIPDSYIEREEKLTIYRRFSKAADFKELKELVNELEDRFGKKPPQVKKFIEQIKFKIYAENNDILKIEEKDNEYEVVSLKNVSQETRNMISLYENEQDEEELKIETISKSKLNEIIHNKMEGQK